MTPQEKDLIQNVFERLSRSGVGQKDAEAEALIRDNMQRIPDAPYGLVQAVIVQEIGLGQANARITELQRQLDEARAASHPQPSGGGSFLAGAGPWGGGSVPRAGAAPVPQPAAPMPSPAGGAAWGQPPAGYAPPPVAGGWAQQPSAAGGFLRNAATMAAGVAGGTLIAEGLSSMFGGHHFGGGYGGGFGGVGGFGGGGPWGGSPSGTVENVTVNNYYGDQGGQADSQGQTQDAGYQDQGQDAGYQDASYDDTSDSGFDGGFDDTSDV